MNMNNKQKQGNKITAQAKAKAQKYYGTSDLSKLAPYQLDKVMSWVMWSEDAGKNRSRKAEMALRQNKKYQGTKRDHTHTKLRQTH